MQMDIKALCARHRIPDDFVPWLTAKWDAGRAQHEGTVGDLRQPQFDFNVAIASEAMDIVLYCFAAISAGRNTQWQKVIVRLAIIMLELLTPDMAYIAAQRSVREMDASQPTERPSPDGTHPVGV